MNNVLITGATGFIGRHLVAAAVKNSIGVRALVRPGNPAIPALKRSGVEVMTGDVMDYHCLRAAAEGVDTIFHLAATVTDWAPKTAYAVNTAGTDNACRAGVAARVRRFVLVSTNDVFGRGEDRIIDESCPLGAYHEPYPDTKRDATRSCWEYHRRFALPVTMAFPCWVYGAGDTSFVPPLADAIYRRRMLFWRRCALLWPTYIDNLIDLLMRIAEDGRAVGNGYLVHDGEATTLQEFCAQIAEALGVPPATAHIPYPAAYAGALLLELLWGVRRKETRPPLTTYAVKNLGSRLRFSIGKAERELGWRPRIPHPEGMKRTMEWLKNADSAALKTK